MRKLNKQDAEIMIKFRVSACTDVSGFGLFGHLKEMIEAACVSAELESKNVPRMEGALELASQGIVPGGTSNNLSFTKNIVRFSGEVREAMKILLADAQTSGGLLISVVQEDADNLLNEIRSSGNAEAAIIGRITSEKIPIIRIN